MKRDRASWWLLSDGLPWVYRGAALIGAGLLVGWSPGVVAAWGIIVAVDNWATRWARMVKTDPDYIAAREGRFRKFTD